MQMCQNCQIAENKLVFIKFFANDLEAALENDASEDVLDKTMRRKFQTETGKEFGCADFVHDPMKRLRRPM